MPLVIRAKLPTNQKLLGEFLEWSYNQIVKIAKNLKIKLPRSKYLD